MTPEPQAPPNNTDPPNNTPPTQESRRPPARYPWHILHTAYVEGWPTPQGHHWPTYDEILERHFPEGRPDVTRKRGARQGWADERAVFQAQVEQRRQEARLRELAASSGIVDERAMRAAVRGLDLVHRKLEEVALDVLHRAEQRAEGKPVALAPRAETAELNQLALAGWRYHVLAMRAVGLEGARAKAGGALPEASEVDAVLVGDVERRLAASVHEALGAARVAVSREVESGDDAASA